MKRIACFILMVGVLLIGVCSVSSATPFKVENTQLADFNLQVTQDWKTYDWEKDGKRMGWRLRYQPGNSAKEKSSLTISLAAEPKIDSSKDEIFAEQARIMRTIKKSHPNGFAVQKVVVANRQTLALRYFSGGNTIFVVLPRNDYRLYEIYIWSRGRANNMPGPVKALLAGLRFKAGVKAKPAVAPVPVKTAVVTGKPTLTPDKPTASVVNPSSIASACYVDDDALSGVVLNLKIGMPLAEVETKYDVVPQSASYNNEAQYRVWKAKIPCLAYYRYSLRYGKGIIKEITCTALSFDVDERAPTKPVTRIVAKIICKEGLEASRDIFGWYAKTYGPPAQKVNKMDKMSQHGSMKMPVLFWHVWKLQGKGNGPASITMKLTRRNDFKYYTIDLDSKGQ